MPTDQPEFGKGFLRGLKKVLFTDGGDAPEASPVTTGASGSNPATSGGISTIPTTPGSANATQAGTNLLAGVHPPSKQAADQQQYAAQPSAAVAADAAAMTERVYQLLESMNQSGIDFLEVWKAARDMGGANPANIRAAYTSLRYADQALTRERLLSSGESYITQLQQIIRAERDKKQEEKKRLETQREETRLRLDNDIRDLEQQIAAMQERLANAKEERTRIDEAFLPKVREIDAKVLSGQQAVDLVIAEIRTVVSIIQQDIN